MPTPLPFRSARLLFLAVIFAGFVADASADTPNRYRVYRGRVVRRSTNAHVPLQPFALSPVTPLRSPMQVAYYAPRAIPRATQPDNDEADTDSSRPEITSSGSHPTVAGSRAQLRNGVAYAPSN